MAHNPRYIDTAIIIEKMIEVLRLIYPDNGDFEFKASGDGSKPEMKWAATLSTNTATLEVYGPTLRDTVIKLREQVWTDEVQKYIDTETSKLDRIRQMMGEKDHDVRP
jgi:hypothetical protein